MKIKVNIQIFAIIIILLLTKQIEMYSWLMLFAFIHEIAHMCAGMALKLKPEMLEIEPFGIGIVFESFENTEKNKIIISLAGPLINLLIAITFMFIKINPQELIINANLLLAIFNLIPIYPLDGGRILKAIIKIKDKKGITEDVLNKISNILMILLTAGSSILILIYKNIGLLLIIAYLWIIVIKENNKYTLKKKINKLLEKQKNTWHFIN